MIALFNPFSFLFNLWLVLFVLLTCGCDSNKKNTLSHPYCLIYIYIYTTNTTTSTILLFSIKMK